MSVFHNNALIGSGGGAGAADALVATKSLRFNSGDSAYLNRTPSSSGNRKTFTFSAWVKRSVLVAGNSPNKEIFIVVGNSDTTHFQLGFRADSLYVANLNTLLRVTSAVFRDTSAWYHIVLAVDTTQSTADDRIKLYVNGSQITSFSSSSNPSQNSDTGVNHTQQHNIGKEDHYFDGYMADIYLIDGSALAPTSFGAYDDNGVWQAAAYSGTYGTNGFHLDFADSSDLGDDNSGNGNDWTPNNLNGTGATASSAAVLNLPLNSTPFADSSASSATVTNTGSVSTASAGTNSFNISNAASLNGSSQRLTTNNNNISFQGSWTIDVYFKIDSGASSGQGLFNSGYGSQTSHYMYIAIDSSDRPFIETSSSGSRSTASAISKNVWYHMRVIQKSGTITMYINGTSVVTHTAQTTDLSTAGSRTIGSLLDNSNNANNFDGLVGPFRIINDALDAPSSGGEATSSGTLANTGTKTVGSEIDVLFDVPTNGTQSDTGAGGEVSGNYATLNPLNKHASSDTISNGNLEASWSGGSACIQPSTIAFSSGKYYYEFLPGISGSIGNGVVGIRRSDSRNHSNTFAYLGNGQKMQNESASNYGSSYTDGDVIGVAVDMDAGTIRFYKNGADQGQAYSGISGTYTFYQGTFGGSNGGGYAVNFGQRPFAYSAPSGFKALCTTNLPTPTIADGSDYFDVDTYTGTGNALERSNFSFTPSFLWFKQRSGSSTSHALIDVVRGGDKRLVSNGTNDEVDVDQFGGGVTSFDSDGFTLGTWTAINDSNETYVAWAWDGGNLATNSSYNQSEVWSSKLSTYQNSFGSEPVTNLFDGDTSTSFYSSSTSGSGIKFVPTTAITGSIELYLRNGDTANSTFSYSLDNGSTFTNLTTTAGNGSYVSIGNQTITNTNGIIVRHVTTAGTNSVNWRAIKVDSKVLVDAGVIPADSISSGSPSVASTVRANQTAGFSIAAFTVSSDGNVTVGHGLGAVPEFIIVKRRTGSEDWYVHHTSLASDKMLKLNTTDGVSNSDVGNSTLTNAMFNHAANAGDHIAYCFTSVAGYSAFGEYDGNGSTDGTFVYTGFRVAFLILKCHTATELWMMHDSTRDPDNVVSKLLQPHTSDAEIDSVTNYGVDFLSNGFKFRSSSNRNNGSGKSYIYLAFAENPFQANGGLAR